MEGVVSKRALARQMIEHLDNITNNKWIAKTETIIDFVIEFCDKSSRTENGMLVKYIPEDDLLLIEKIDEIINKFYANSGDYYKPGSAYFKGEIELVDNEIGEMRAELSSLLYVMSRKVFRDLSLKKASAIAEREKAEADAYQKIFSATINTKIDNKAYTQSFADSYARKMYKSDPVYQDTIKRCDKSEQDYWEMLQIFTQAKEVLNAMSKRKDNF